MPNTSTTPHPTPVRRAEIAAALAKITTAIVEAVAVAGPLGAPGGVLYAACMGHITLPVFKIIMSTLVEQKKLRREGDLYFVIQPEAKA